MIEENIFEKVLVEPVNKGGNKLYVVSGYATAAMAFHHFEHIKRDLNKTIHISLIVGMCPTDGLSLSNHRAFQKLVLEDLPDNFECSYVFKSPAVHAKAYAWFQDDKPLNGFIGSANYTQNAFSKNQRELLSDYDPEKGHEYFNRLATETIYCTHPDVENSIRIFHDAYYGRARRAELEESTLPTITPANPDLEGLPAIRVSLLDNQGELPQRSGLNWGQRPEERREPNQAYIRLPAIVYHTDFFPPIAVHFTILTDDNKVLICTRAQQNGKAIHTPHNNSLIGEYFRRRLGVPFGEPITTEHLRLYGRTDVDFYKIDDETYFMDFSPRN